MSRIANSPVSIPAGVTVNISGQNVEASGSKGKMHLNLHPDVTVNLDDGTLYFKTKSPAKSSKAQAGTARALVNNIIIGVSVGFEIQLQLVGVGYRAQVSGQKLTLSLGFSHPVELDIPEGVAVDLPSNTLITLRGTDKQQLGQFAANIRKYRLPEPYKGKGIRFVGELVRRKEAKKK